MNPIDQKLRRLIVLASQPASPPAAVVASPWFARRVVQRWLAEDPAAVGGTSWRLVSRRGLVCAVAVMGVSLALNAHLWWHQDSPERLASESVVLFVLPR